MGQMILGLIGTKGSGKDTVAGILTKSKDWVRVAFADPLYAEVAEAFGVSVAFLQNRDTKETPLPQLALSNCNQDLEEGVPTFAAMMLANYKLPQETTLEAMAKPRSPREILQLWGSEYRRALFRDDYWLQQAKQVIQARPDLNFVISDVRYPNEVAMLKSINGVLARIVRPAMAVQGDPAMLHSSEQMMLNQPVDITLVNEEGPKGLSSLEAQVSQKFLH